MDFGHFTEFYPRIGKPHSKAFEDTFKEIDAAERLGIDSLWLAEDHFTNDYSLVSSPLVMASAIAARTKRMRVGLGVLILPLYNPLQTAEEAATVDQISEGRLDFGIGRSGVTNYYLGYNIDYNESRPRFAEALEIILKAWGDEPLSYQGEYYNFGHVNVVPKPVQKPHPPIRVAAVSEDTFHQMGQSDYPICLLHLTGIPLLEERLKVYRKAKAEAGHTTPDDVVLRIPAYVAETTQRALADAEASTMRHVEIITREFLAYANEEATEFLLARAGLPYEEIQKECIFGSPEAVTEVLQEYKERLGLSGVILELNHGGQIPLDRVVNGMQLLAEKVIPNFK